MKHRLFIGSSTEGLALTNALASLMCHEFTVVPWTQNVFEPGSNTIDALLAEVNKCQFAVFLFTADDLTLLRGRKFSTARDNVIFEFGLFLSRLGTKRCFFLVPDGHDDFRIPTDLDGIITLCYDASLRKTDPSASVGGCVASLKTVLAQFILGTSERFSLSGHWIQNWHVQSSRYKPQNPSPAEIAQIGDKFYATAIAKPVTTKEGRPFIIEGEIEGRYITGRWYDSAKGATYFGAFQLVIDLVPNRMVGQWIGFSDSGKIKSGEWVWERLETLAPSTSTKRDNPSLKRTPRKRAAN